MSTPDVEADPRRALRRLFLLLFLRGRSARGRAGKRAPTSLPRHLALTLAVYALVGCMPLAVARGSPSALSLATHATTFLMLALIVAAAAGEVLFARDEGDILLHRPVSPRDLLRAKTRVLIEVSLWLAGALNLAPIVAGALGAGGVAFALAHAASTAVEAVCCVALIALTYQLCLRWFGRERLDMLMTTAQVVMASLMAVAGQVAPRLAVGAVGAAPRGAWPWLLPPVWFAALDDALRGVATPAALGGAALAVAVTAGAAALAFTTLAGDYGRGLQALGEAPAAPARAGRRWADRLVAAPPLRWWLRDPVERASFLLCVAYLLRDRETRLRVYPALAPMLALPVVLLLAGRGDADDAAIGVAFCSAYLGLVPLLGQEHLRFSQQWQAAEVFRCAPLAGPGPLCHGARRAALVVLTAPVAAVFIALVLVARRAQLALLLPGLIALPVYALLPCLGGRSLPLATPSEAAKATRRGLTMMLLAAGSFMVSLIGVWAHHGGWLRWLVLGEAVGAVIAMVALRAAIARARWASVE